MSGTTTGRPETVRDPWRVLINVAQIPETGLHREIVADETARKAMAEAAELREVISAHGRARRARRQ